MGPRDGAAKGELAISPGIEVEGNIAEGGAEDGGRVDGIAVDGRLFCEVWG